MEKMDKEKFLVWLELLKQRQPYEVVRAIEKIEKTVEMGTFDTT